MNTITIGRCGLDVPLRVPESGTWSDGESLSISGTLGAENGYTVADSVSLLWQLNGLANMFEPVVACTFSDTPSLDGFYRLGRVSVKTDGASWATGAFGYTVDLQRLAASVVDSRLVHALRSGSAISASDATGLVGIPGSATVYRRGTIGLGSLDTRTCDGGTVEVGTWLSNAAQANAEWQAPPAGFYQGAAQLLTGPALLRPPITDTFTRANSTTNLGSTEGDVPKAWTQLGFAGGVLGINGNKGYCSTVDGAALFAYLDSGEADGHVESTVTYPAAAWSVTPILFRADLGALNTWYVISTSPTDWALVKLSGGVPTTVDTYTGPNIASRTLTVRAEYEGSAIRVLIDGVEVMTATDATHATETEVGWSINDLNSRIDNFATGVMSDGADVGTIDTQLDSYRAVLGRQIPGDLDPNTSWCLTNGLTRIYPSEGIGGTPGTITAEAYAGAAWESLTEIQVDNVSTFTGATIIRNSPEACTIRLSAAGLDDALCTIDLTVRRGDRNLLGVTRHPVSGSRFVIINSTATAITGAVRLTSDDADGNRWVMSTALGTLDSSGPVTGVTTTGTVLDFGFGVEIGGSGSAGIDDDQALANQYAAVVGETCRIVNA